MDWRIDLDLPAVGVRTLAARPAAIRTALEHIGEVSAQQTPILEGTLVRSQSIRDVSEDTGSIGYYTPYAVYVHEILRYRHPHGNAKFLEIPLLSESEIAVKMAAQVIGEAI